MIDNAKLNKVIRTASHFRIAIEHFQERTRALPGDAGERSGLPYVHYRQGWGDENATVTGLEVIFVKMHLVAHGLIPETRPLTFYTSGNCYDPTTATVDCWLAGFHQGPTAVGTGKAIFTLHSSQDNGGGFLAPFPWFSPFATNSASDGDLFISYGSEITPSNQRHSLGAVLTPAQALAIDSKVDDGIATTGKVLGHPGMGDSSSCGWPGCDCIDDGHISDALITDGNTYNINNQNRPGNPDCIVLFKIGKYSTLDAAPF